MVKLERLLKYIKRYDIAVFSIFGFIIVTVSFIFLKTQRSDNINTSYIKYCDKTEYQIEEDVGNSYQVTCKTKNNKITKVILINKNEK